MFVIWIYLALINVSAFTLMSYDKSLARRGGRRVRERTLLLAAAAGGSLGALIAMKRSRHKTKHAAFSVGIPVLLIVHALLLAYWLSR